MKSLEILNQLEEKYHSYVIDLYYSTNMSKDKRKKLYYMYDSEFNKIKQDLEVLEIMKKFFNDFEPEMDYWDWRQSYTLAINGEIIISKEEKDKLKQWLEE